MKYAPLLLAFFMPLSIGGAQGTSVIQTSPKQVPETYLKTDVSSMEVDVNEGTLYLTIKDERLTYIPPLSGMKWPPGVIPPLSSDRHGRVIECLAVQTSIANAQKFSFTRYGSDNSQITSLSIFTLPK